jgi:hypothetical protein
MSLAKMSVGDVVKFSYSSPEGTSVEGGILGIPYKYFNRTTPYVGRVEAQRNMTEQPIQVESEYNYVCDRSENMTTLAMDGRYGCFYDGRAFNVKKVGLLGRLVMWLKGTKFTG